MVERSFEQRISAAITVAKAFALISIVCAHIGFSAGTPYAITKIYSAIASIGVVCYLFAAGYYYNPPKYTFAGLLKNKATTIVLPWAFLGTIMYLYNAILSKNLSIIGYLKWIIGNGSFLYFMTVLVICFLIFYRANKIVLIASIVVNLISLALTATKVIDPVIKVLHITNYLNVFNWIGIFVIGMLVKRVPAEKFYLFIRKTRFVFLGLFAVAVALVCVFNVGVGYFSYVGIWLELLGTLAILGISTAKIFENKFVFDVSNLSFTIYLVHMMVIGVFDRLYNIHPITQAMAVFIIIGISYIALSIARWAIRFVKLEKYLFPLFGFRARKLEIKEK